MAIEAEHYKSKVTVYVFACWILAAFGGLMFGYDIGISGGVTGMDDFLIEFFPHVHERKMNAKENNYCKYDDQRLQLFTSSLYLAALVASFFASKACNLFGRRLTILTASAFFIAGVALSSAGKFLWMLILGRILFGVGVGFGNEAVPLFLSEIAPIHQRGAINILFQLFVTIGILIANVINYGTSKMHPNGWRVSLGLAGVPGLVLLIGSALIITETPTSLVQRGKQEQGKAALKRLRGVDDVDAEFHQVVLACEQAEQGETKPFRKLLTKPSVPPLTISVWMQIFQQFTGINAVMFYAPVLFQTMGFKSDGALLASVITGLINVCATFVSIYAVDRLGRRKLLLQACVQMFVSLVIVGSILLTHLKVTGSMDKHLAAVVVVFVCTFVMSFAWSWGPMGWLIPSEVFPVETKTSGFAIAVSTNMIFTFLIAQVFLSMLCHMRAYIFFFFAAWIVVMGLFVVFLVPETKGVPTEQIDEILWKPHPIWKNFVAGQKDLEMQQTA